MTMTYNKTLQLRKNDVVRIKKTGEIGRVHATNGDNQYTLVVLVIVGAAIRTLNFKELELLKSEYSSSDSKPSVCPICERRSLSYNLSSAVYESFGDVSEIPWECGSCGAKGKEQYAQTLFGQDFAGHTIIDFGEKKIKTVQHLC